MNQNRFQEAKRIYNSALEREPHQREAYLKKVCAGDQSLRKEVESLLACQPEAQEFFKAPADGGAPVQLTRKGGFRPYAGNIVSYDLKTSTRCGQNSNMPCDPRAIGMSPIISRQLALLPAGNDPSLADGLNTIGVRGPVDTSIKSDNFLGRMDYKINDKWNLNANYIWALQSTWGASFIDLRGGASNFKSLTRVPNHPFHYSFGLTGNVKPTLINELRFGFNRSSIVFEHPDPSTLSSGAGMALGNRERVARHHFPAIC